MAMTKQQAFNKAVKHIRKYGLARASTGGCKYILSENPKKRCAVGALLSVEQAKRLEEKRNSSYNGKGGIGTYYSNESALIDASEIVGLPASWLRNLQQYTHDKAYNLEQFEDAVVSFAREQELYVPSSNPQPTARNIQRLLTVSKFQAYLDDQDQDASAGTCGVAFECAVSQYLTNKLDCDERRISTTGDIVVYDLRIPEYKSGKVYKKLRVVEGPPWVQRFIGAFDGIPLAYGKSQPTFGQAAEVLRNLDA